MNNPLAIVEQGTLNWQYDGLSMWLARLEELEGKWVQVPLPKPVAKTKTQNQMGYYFAVVLPVAHAAMLGYGWAVDGVPIIREMADAYLKAKCGEHLYEDGKFQKRKASKEDMRQFIDRVIQYVNHKFETQIPEARE